MADVELKGVPQLLAKLASVKNDAKYKSGRFALRKAAQVYVKKIKQNAARLDDPKSAADISKNVAERWNGRLFKRTGNLGFRVGILGGAGGNKKSSELSGLPGGDTRHWRQLEFGNEHMRAQPFMRRAGEDGAQEATDEFVRQYSKGLDRAIKRGAK